MRLRYTLLLLVAFATCLWWWYCVPKVLFDAPMGAVLLGADGSLMGARIAADGQWRLAPPDSVPVRWARCITAFEDRRFYRHPGVDPLALARAMWQNAKARTTVSGGSTITMQCVRLSRQNPPRTLWEKALEIAMATRVEMRYSKAQILAMYAAHAPFGGNVVGLEAAAWRYYGKPPHTLSWAEAATLAVLPNAPALVYPGRSDGRLLSKRNRLLAYLHSTGALDRIDLELALAEPLPQMPHAIPQGASHLLATSMALQPEQPRIHTTLLPHLQAVITERTNRFAEANAVNHVYNAAVLVAEVKTGKVIAYVGNAHTHAAAKAQWNDMVHTPRSTGSIFKPLLYAQMLERGHMTPWALVPDIPTQYAGFAPRNFDLSYSGAVPAQEALARSLNIPFVRMLRTYGVPAFHKDLKEMGFTTLHQPPSHYGLSLILGGAEATLWDLAKAYRMLAATAQGHRADALAGLHYSLSDTLRRDPWPTGHAAAISTTQALSTLHRPSEENSWEYFENAQAIAWKTGTSFGLRDAWAVGYNRSHVVAVWVGNSSGEGRPGLTGLKCAAPLMLSVFQLLPNQGWDGLPADGVLTSAEVCAASGMLASPRCAKTSYRAMPPACLETEPCHHCRIVHTDAQGMYRVHADCYITSHMKTAHFFVLPPLQEHYYRNRHIHYRALPPMHPGCQPTRDEQPMRFVYPNEVARILAPRELDGQRQIPVMKAVHRRPDAMLFWYLDEAFLGTTQGRHILEVPMTPGTHTLTITDDEGHRLSRTIEVE